MVMATFIQSMKSESQWTINDLHAYNINVFQLFPQDVATCFGNPTLPLPLVYQVILDNQWYPLNGIANGGTITSSTIWKMQW